MILKVYIKPEMRLLDCVEEGNICAKMSYTTGTVNDETGSGPVMGGDAADYRSGIWDDEETNPFNS